LEEFGEAGKREPRMPSAELNAQFCLVGAEKTRMQIGVGTAKPVIRFQVEMRTLLETGLEVICDAFWRGICLHFVCEI
jgi:hypothetical protein